MLTLGIATIAMAILLNEVRSAYNLLLSRPLTMIADQRSFLSGASLSTGIIFLFQNTMDPLHICIYIISIGLDIASSISATNSIGIDIASSVLNTPQQ